MKVYFCVHNYDGSKNDKVFGKIFVNAIRIPEKRDSDRFSIGLNIQIIATPTSNQKSMFLNQDQDHFFLVQKPG